MMSFKTESNPRLQQVSEMIIVALACLAPWAFGAVEAWAELGLYIGVAALAIVGAVSGWGKHRSRDWLSAPSLILAGLLVLALIQRASLPESFLKLVSPPSAALRTSLLPRVPERVSGDEGPTVPLSRPTLSQEPEATSDLAVRLAATWILFQSVLGLRGGYRTFRRFAAAIVGNATLLALFSLVQSLSWNGKIYWIRPSPSSNGGPFVCHNHLAASLNVGLGLALGFLLAPERDRIGSDGRGRRLWAAYAVGLIVVGIVASLSRSAFLAMAASLVATMIVWRPRGLYLRAGLAAVVVLVPVFLFALGTTAPYQQRLATLMESAPYSDRLQIWRDAVRAWPIYPVWGLGLGTFVNTTTRFFQHETGERYVHAENEYVEWLVEGGALGLGLYLALLATIARLGRRVLDSAPSESDQALVLGGLFSGLTLVIHSFGDFALRIPGVAVAAVVLGAHLCRLGLDAKRDSSTERPSRSRLLASSVLGISLALLSLILLEHGINRARVERSIAGKGIPLVGTGGSPAGQKAPDWEELDRRREALEQALRVRPDWVEGHLRLGLTLLSLYEMEASEALKERVKDSAARAVLIDPNWLRGIEVDELLTHPLIRDYQVRAARSFLEARRCCPVLALSHAKLASLDFLLQRNDSSSVYLSRALRLSGANEPLITLITQSAIQTGDRDLAARCWRKMLLIDSAEWESVADSAGVFLTPDEILRVVLPDGRLTLRFADRLYLDPEDRATRDQFLRAAIARLPQDRQLNQAERLQLEAQAWARLDDREQALERMQGALALEPRCADWRKDLVSWLIAWGRNREAHDQALIGLHLSPNHPDALRALDSAAEALARGTATPSSPDDQQHQFIPGESRWHPRDK
jgi:O-antigen ligase/tetratricopeptide (TPR) repeat protein